MAKSWPVGGVIAVGAVIFVVGLTLRSGTADLLSTAVLGSTLAAAIWYSLETRMLRQEQQRDNEIRHHPWLKGSDLKVTCEVIEAKIVWREIIYLPIQNMGTTPAHNLEIVVQWRVEGTVAKSGTERIGGITLPPGDTYHAKLCEIEFDPGDKASIDVEITYRSFVGGGGCLKMNFYTPEKGWANGPMSPYKFWLSDGRIFPAQRAALHNPADGDSAGA